MCVSTFGQQPTAPIGGGLQHAKTSCILVVYKFFYGDQVSGEKIWKGELVAQIDFVQGLKFTVTSDSSCIWSC